jgi:hypothetical protein
LSSATGKNDVLDAEQAARQVLSGQATAVPKSTDGAVEMIRIVKIARDTAVKALSSGTGHAQSDARHC